MADQQQLSEVDVAAVVAEEVARHAPGTAVAGPESGGVQVIRVSLDETAFRQLLTAIAPTLGEGSHLRLDVVGGVLYLDVTKSRAGADDVSPIHDLAHAMGGHVVPDPLAPEGFSVQVPTGLIEWD